MATRPKPRRLAHFKDQVAALIALIGGGSARQGWRTVAPATASVTTAASLAAAALRFLARRRPTRRPLVGDGPPGGGGLALVDSDAASELPFLPSLWRRGPRPFNLKAALGALALCCLKAVYRDERIRPRARRQPVHSPRM